MPVKIEKLTCRVSVTTGRKKSVLHGSTAPPKPTMHFALPSVEPHSEAPQPSPGRSIVGESSHGAGSGHGQNSAAPVRTADVRAVSDRVYELMTQEIALAKRRGMG
ncbi:MAG: hypothetical protein M3Y28_10485 [Armatimonadota bacterium]|nr:hypothetical protein [Armatimonadota bacterium]